jgi:ribosomal protein S18 acetylase RimI-like enzyme
MEVLSEKTSTIYVNSIGVINELRSFRIGSKLLDKVKEEANKRKSVRYISLRMFEYNFSGEQFYLRNGFFKIRILNNAWTFND